MTDQIDDKDIIIEEPESKRLDPDLVEPTGEMHTCKNGNQYPLVNYKGGTYYQLSNGTLMDPVTAKMATSPHPDKLTFNYDIKKVMAARKQKAAEAVIEGMSEGVLEFGKLTGLKKVSEFDAVRLIAKRIAGDAMTKNGRPLIEAADWLLKNSLLNQVDDHGSTNSNDPVLRLDVSERGMELLAGVLGKIQEQKNRLNSVD